MGADSLERPEDSRTVYDDIIVVIDALHQPAIAIRHEQRHLHGDVARRLLGGAFGSHLLVDIGSVFSVKEGAARQEHSAALTVEEGQRHVRAGGETRGRIAHFDEQAGALQLAELTQSPEYASRNLDAVDVEQRLRGQSAENVASGQI